MKSKVIRVLGTGGTIAGVAPAGAADNRYTAGQLAVRELLAPLMPIGLADAGQIDAVEPVEVAQIDSSNMSLRVWADLAAAVARVQQEPQVQAAVITHGTDTLEETAVFLDTVVAIEKPVVMTAAMRPATSQQADGPAHLRQALVLAADPRAHGLLFAFAGCAWRAADVRKVDPFALQAFGAAAALPVARWEPGESHGRGEEGSGQWRWLDESKGPRALAAGQGIWRMELPQDLDQWPEVDIVSSHAGADGRVVRALLEAGVQGLVISATGNGSVHESIDAALREAVREGRLRRERVLVASRCILGPVVGEPVHGWPMAPSRTPAQARVELMLRILRGQS